MHNRVVFLIGMAAGLVACVPGADTANGGLANTSWTVISVAGQPTAPEGMGPTMTFAPGGTVSGNSGCNQYSGSFRTDGDRIAFGPVSSTLMGCDGPRGQVEALFLQALDGATTWRQTETGELEIGGTLAMVARPGVAMAQRGHDRRSEEPVAALAVAALAGPVALAFVRG